MSQSKAQKKTKPVAKAEEKKIKKSKAAPH
jgi:hypothetical protein